jgi:hypothetical protein
MLLRVLLIPLAVLGACSREAEPVTTTAQCMAGYDDKQFDQCIAACIKCEKGVMTTCATACRLRGAKDRK